MKSAGVREIMREGAGETENHCLRLMKFVLLPFRAVTLYNYKVTYFSDLNFYVFD